MRRGFLSGIGGLTRREKRAMLMIERTEGDGEGGASFGGVRKGHLEGEKGRILEVLNCIKGDGRRSAPPTSRSVDEGKLKRTTHP